MTDKSLEERIAKLEAACTSIKPPELSGEALLRVRMALYEALEASNAAALGERPAVGPASIFSFGDAVKELFARVEAGEMTPEDKLVLDSLPVDDLQKLGMTAQEVVALYATVFKQF